MTPSQSLIEDQWEVIRRLLPDDLEQSARDHGAMRRRRGQVSSAEQLLRLILMHVAGGLSLEQTVTRAQARGLATLNAMALHKRLCTSSRWLEALTGYLLQEIQPHLRQNEDCWGIGRRVRILDATDVHEPGSTGSSWRLHYSLRLPEMCCDFFELTDYHGAESLRRLPVEPGDLVLVDRGYNDRKAVGQILDCGGELIMRYNSGAFPLLNPAGQPFDPLPKLRPLKIGQTGEWKVRFVVENGRQLSARLCALRKSPEQARRARVRAQRKSKRNNSQVRPETLEYADYVVLLSTLSSQEMKLAVVLEFYRARWQVELAFKRLKSLLQMGQVPKKKEASCRAWMQGKILTALLIERLLCEARFFSPWGYPL
jgi:Transposase DDE domain